MVAAGTVFELNIKFNSRQQLKILLFPEGLFIKNIMIRKREEVISQLLINLCFFLRKTVSIRNIRMAMKVSLQPTFFS